MVSWSSPNCSEIHQWALLLHWLKQAGIPSKYKVLPDIRIPSTKIRSSYCLSFEMEIPKLEIFLISKLPWLEGQTSPYHIMTCLKISSTTWVSRSSPTWQINSLWPSDTIWRHKSGSTLAQVMACCLMAPSHYLNLCWLITSRVQWYSSECNFTRNTSAISHWN